MAPDEGADGTEGVRPSVPSRPAPRRAALAWLMLALALACAIVTTLSAEARGRLSLSDALLTVAALIFSGVGALIASRRPQNALAWVFAGAGLSAALHVAGRSYAEYGLSLRPEKPAGVAVAAWLSGWTFLVATALLLVFVPFLFPDGALPSRRWGLTFIAATTLFLMGTIGSALVPGPLPDEDLPFDNPVGIEALGALLGVGVPLSLAGLAGLMPVAVASLALRYRSAGPVQRQQIKWLLYPTGLLAAAAIADDIVLNGLAGIEDTVVSSVIEGVGILGVPIGAGIAVLRHRLLDIDVVIQRSLVFATLTAAIGISYAVLVSSMAEVLPDERGLGLFIATAVVAVLFAPLRERVERSVTRLLYGERRDPYTAVTRLGRQMVTASESSAILPLLVETIGQTLNLSYAAIEVDADEDNGDSLRSEVGTAQGEVTDVPLWYQGDKIGRLRLAARGPGDRLSAADRLLIDDLARLAAVTAHSIRLAGDLQRSRRRLVVAREEERSRLRRDLHDGLGPTLAGVAFQLAGVDAHTEPAAVDARVAKLRAEIQMAIAEVRRLVDDLRPPALDELGLAGAIERHAALFQGGPKDGSGSPSLAVTIQVADDLQAPPPAVEVAAYRIVTEALTNVARHARATSCTVRIWVDRGLHLEVADNGRGIPDDRNPGVGLRSMRERASEVGGDFVVDSSSDAGTRLRARLPLDGQ